jgi:hypothetical protein
MLLLKAHANTGCSCPCLKQMRIQGAHAVVQGSCQYWLLMPLFNAHLSIGCTCRGTRLVPVQVAHAVVQASCQYRVLMPLFNAYARKRCSCKRLGLMPVQDALAPTLTDGLDSRIVFASHHDEHPIRPCMMSIQPDLA